MHILLTGGLGFIGSAVVRRLIATTDLHASLLPYDYHANRPVAGRSLCNISDSGGDLSRRW